MSGLLAMSVKQKGYMVPSQSRCKVKKARKSYMAHADDELYAMDRGCAK